MAVSKRLRYEVLRRDNYTCRYCGVSAPEVKLTVDHVTPTALGGSDLASNLASACAPCNSGKSSTSPDAPIVEDVKQSALMFARALAMVAAERNQEREYREGLLDAVAYDCDQWGMSLPVDWKTSVLALHSAGLDYSDMTELIEVAATSRTVKDEWRYFCGCAWKRLQADRDRAAELISVGVVR